MHSSQKTCLELQYKLLAFHHSRRVEDGKADAAGDLRWIDLATTDMKGLFITAAFVDYFNTFVGVGFIVAHCQTNK